MNSDDLKILKEALAAVPRMEWTYSGGTVTIPETEEDNAEGRINFRTILNKLVAPKFGRFVAAANPSRISRMVARLEALELREHQAAATPKDTVCALAFYFGCANKLAPTWLPSRIFLPKLVRGDFPIGHETIAEAGEHDCQSNKWGALSVLATNGKQLGIKPGEYTPVAWRRNEEATYG